MRHNRIPTSQIPLTDLLHIFFGMEVASGFQRSRRLQPSHGSLHHHIGNDLLLQSCLNTLDDTFNTPSTKLTLNANMKEMAIYLMLVLGGNATPSADDVTTALGAVGMTADSERLSTLMTELAGKDLNELLETGTARLAKLGGGGGGGGGGYVSCFGNAEESWLLPLLLLNE